MNSQTANSLEASGFDDEELLLVIGRVMENQELLHKRLDDLADWTHEMKDYVKVTTSTFEELVKATKKGKGF